MSGRVGFTRIWTRRFAPLPLSVSDDPAGGVAGRDRPRAGQALARLQRNGRDLPDCGIDLIERAFGPRINLDSIVVAFAARLYTGGGIGVLDAAGGRGGGGAAARHGPRGRNMQRPGRVVGCRRLHGRQRRHAVVIAPLLRAIGGAACEHGGRKQHGRNGGRAGDRPHWLISRDHEIALT